MIGFLRGALLEKRPGEVIVEAGGVGYEVQIPISTYTAMPDAGAIAALRVYTHVREDAIVLYGFATRVEQQVFERLIAVSNVGPRLAITVLSGLPTNDLITAIRSGDVAQLVRIPGVGKKTAERLVLELKDKLEEAARAVEPASVAPGSGAQRFSGLENDVISALANLGCSRPAAEAAVRQVAERRTGGAPTEFEEFFRAAMALVR